MDLVTEFKKRVKDFEKDEGIKYKIHYKGYKEALESNRLHVYWHKPGILAEVTANGKKYTIGINGNLDCELISPEGKSVMHYTELLSPMEVDGKEILQTDKDIVSLEDMSRDDGWSLNFKSVSSIYVSDGDNQRDLEETSIVKAIFDTRLFREPDSPIVDSGQRTRFASGAVRDVQIGKGRCDLLPLDIVQEFFNCKVEIDNPFDCISKFQETKDRMYLIMAAKAFAAEKYDSEETAILEYACHLENGCRKYGDRNWQKGIPIDRYIDSGIRHLLKNMRGDTDERHDRAFIWNMLGGAWTLKHHPELGE